MSVLGVLFSREAIIAVAICGALLCVVGSFRAGRNGPAGVLVKTGYALTGVSMLLMIVAGFMSGR
ncbi:hypothetical protein ACIKTA_00810 [Hansschlegelia beijingensis]|uniref:hypothetical protein n=1 Tax=Hansschlegelia beijingensis TaxID=1133344 RepID=UPI003828FDC6